MKGFTKFTWTSVFLPYRIFAALLISVTIWLFPAMSDHPTKTETTRSLPPLHTFNSIPLVYAGTSREVCAPSCQIQVCVRWIPGPSDECPRPGPGGGCCTDYETDCDPGCAEPPTPIPPPSISASLNCSSWGDNGWCGGTLSITFTASDPSGQAVIISGSLDGDPFACPAGDTTCSIAINIEGTGTVSYVVNSATGLSSSGSTSYKLDWTTPQIDGSFSGIAGSNGWYVSDVDLNASASDATAGLALFEMSLDGITYTTYTDTTLGDGVHTIYLRATDQAGNSTQTTQTFNVDTITPSLSLSTSGTKGPTGWYRASVQVTASASDGGSGLA
jgi:hypothetical protein